MALPECMLRVVKESDEALIFQLSGNIYANCKDKTLFNHIPTVEQVFTTLMIHGPFVIQLEVDDLFFSDKGKLLDRRPGPNNELRSINFKASDYLCILGMKIQEERISLVFSKINLNFKLSFNLENEIYEIPFSELERNCYRLQHITLSERDLEDRFFYIFARMNPENLTEAEDRENCKILGQILHNKVAFNTNDPKKAFEVLSSICERVKRLENGCILAKFISYSWDGIIDSKNKIVWVH